MAYKKTKISRGLRGESIPILKNSSIPKTFHYRPNRENVYNPHQRGNRQVIDNAKRNQRRGRGTKLRSRFNNLKLGLVARNFTPAEKAKSPMVGNKYLKKRY